MTIKRKKSRFAKEIVTEITGFAPYEKRTMELLRVQRDKRALKFLKKRVSSVEPRSPDLSFYSLLELYISLKLNLFS